MSRLTRLALRNFKGFADLTIELDSAPKLVVLCGPNGSGKSSVLDGLNYWRRSQVHGIHDPEFFWFEGRSGGPGQLVEATFDVPPSDPRAAVYLRTAQRVTVDFATQGGLFHAVSVVDEQGPGRSIEIDDRVGQDFARLVSESINALWSPVHASTPAGDIVARLVGAVQKPLGELLEGLTFEGPGNPIEQSATFRFSRRNARGFPYKLLSGGEKAVFDLLLDVVVNREALGSAVWCIDEPETHVNAAVHGALLDALFDLIPDAGQLIIATHSAGMLAHARERQLATPADIAFVDFADLGFSTTTVLRPVTVTRPFWRRQLGVALGDLAGLLAPKRLVLCEGDPDRRDRPTACWDAKCLETIFADHEPDAAFVSVGNADDVVGDRMDIGRTVETLVDDMQVLRVIDRDARSPFEVAELERMGCRVMRRRHLEAYLLDDEVLETLAHDSGHPDKANQLRDLMAAALKESMDRGNPTDDYKSASGLFMVKAKRLLQITAGGNTREAFLRDTVAPCLRPTMGAYCELREDIFGPSS